MHLSEWFLVDGNIIFKNLEDQIMKTLCHKSLCHHFSGIIFVKPESNVQATVEIIILAIIKILLFKSLILTQILIKNFHIFFKNYRYDISNFANLLNRVDWSGELTFFWDIHVTIVVSTSVRLVTIKFRPN